MEQLVLALHDIEAVRFGSFVLKVIITIIIYNNYSQSHTLPFLLKTRTLILKDIKINGKKSAHFYIPIHKKSHIVS